MPGGERIGDARPPRPCRPPWRPGAAAGARPRGAVGALPSLPGAGEVAIKRLRTVGGAGEEQLHTELAALSECRHENLLPIIGCCLDRRGLCLVPPTPADPSRKKYEIIIVPTLIEKPSQTVPRSFLN